ncbi:MAG: hypothetical protein KBF21_18745 [Thermoanaerobaculia bacterium]|nr:hypothetical protein [Thermoanaerobaculia bacterium]MBP9826273.1 hypothetical protein [Thermoanaerobaculia bacterium]
MKVRTALLAMLLLDLAAGATWFAGRYGSGQPDALRLFLAWALPGLVFVCGLLTRERKARRAAAGQLPPRLRLPGIPLRALPPPKPSLPIPPAPLPAPRAVMAPESAPPAPGLRWSRLLLWIGVAIAVDLAPIGIAYQLGWLTLTYGDQQLAATRAATALWALPLLVLLAVRFYERTLRGRLYQEALESWGAPAAWTLSLLCGTALALPAIAPGLSISEPAFVAAALVTALAREIGSTVLYRASGLLAAGIFRGTLLFVDFYLIADWLAPVFPSANYVTSGDVFYLLRAASPLVAALLLVRFLPARGAQAPGLPTAAPAA